LPLLCNAAGEKLSKQTRAPALERRDPVPQLLTALRRLGQAVPAELAGASLDEFWTWAIAHWRLAAIPRDVPPTV
jgi:glutamyl-Q tRNA(Asp) synthetase